MRQVYPEEQGKIEINGHKMEWKMRRSKGESCFGIRGSRIFDLNVWKDSEKTLEYEHGYSMKPEEDDEETKVCLNYLLDKFGKEKKKEKKDERKRSY